MSENLSDSLWYDTCAENVTGGTLRGAHEADLVIIGGGYTGLSAAIQAMRDGASVVLVEAQEFGDGGSGRNVGLANAGLWLPPEDIANKLGQEAGDRLTSILGGAPDLVYGLINAFEMDCEPVRNGTLHCAHAPKAMADLKNRHRQLSERGAPVQLLDRDAAVGRVGSDQVHGALFDPRAGTIQPLAYAKGLARAATELGAKLYEHSPAQSVEKLGPDWHVTTPNGRIVANKLMMATNGYTQPLKGLDVPQIVPVHYFQAATAPLSAAQQALILPNKEGCWDTALVMSSWRLDQAGRMIIGGMGELGHIGQAAHRKWLDRKLAKMFPTLAGTELLHTWFGRIAMTAEYMPKILALDSTALVSFGYSGRGIGPGTVFGQRMAQALLGGEFTGLPVAPVTEHSLPFAGIRQAYYETGATLTHLVKDRL